MNARLALLGFRKQASDSWVGFDLDGTLALREEPFDAKSIGEPIPKMIKKLQEHLDAGDTCKIMTARISDYSPDTVKRIQDWLEEQDLPRLEVTNEKDPGMVTLYDDRAVSVKTDEGTTKEASVKELLSRPCCGSGCANCPYDPPHQEGNTKVREGIEKVAAYTHAKLCPGCLQPFPEGEPLPDVEMCERCERYGPPKSASLRGLETEGIPSDVIFFTDGKDRATASLGDWHDDAVWDTVLAFGKKQWKNWEDPDDSEIGRPSWATKSLSTDNKLEKAAVIKQEGDQWILYTKDGKRVLGRHKSKQDAIKQEYAIQKSEERRKAAAQAVQFWRSHRPAIGLVAPKIIA